MNAYTDKYVDYNDGLMYENYFGGVVAMTVEHFKQVSRRFIFYFYTFSFKESEENYVDFNASIQLQVNGFSNRFWGWGGEDDDMANRIFANDLYISRYPSTISR